MDDSAPRIAEAVPVVLARMEGKLDGIQDKVGDLVLRVSKVEDRQHDHEARIQTLALDAKAEEAKKIALALALKEAEETRRTQAEQTWTPVQRFMAILGSAIAAVTLGIYLYSTVHH